MSNANLIFDILANDRASSTIRGIGDTVEGQTGKWDKWKKAGAVGAAVVAAAVVKFASDSVQAYSDAEEAQKSLQFAFDKFPKLADVNIQALRDLNTELAKKTKFDDDAIATGQAALAQFDLTGQQIKDVTPLLVDYASKTGKDLPSAAQDLGKALLGNAKALKNIGISYKSGGDGAKELGKVQDKAAAAAEALASKQQALADLQTIQGAKAKLTVADGIAMRKAQDAVTAAQEKATQTQTALTAATAAAGKPGQDFANITQLMRDKIGGFAEKEGTTAAGKLAILKNQFGELEESVGQKMMPALTKLADIGLKVIDWISKNTQVVGPLIGVIAAVVAVQWLWNIAMAANPIGLIIIGIAAAIAAIVLLVTHWQTVLTWLKTHWPLVLEIITGPIGLAVLVISKHWDSIKAFFSNGLQDIIGFFKPVANALTAPFRKAFNTISDLWNGTIGGFTVDLPAILGGAHLSIPRMPHISAFANGTMNAPGGLALVGERGPELVNLPPHSQVFPNGTGPGGNTFNIYEAVSAEATAMQVARRQQMRGA